MNIKNIIENSNLHISKEQIYYNEPMKKHTSFKVGGPVDVFINVNDKDELIEIEEFAKKNNIFIKIIGNGTNLLVVDEGINGIIVKINLKRLEIISEKDDEILVKIGAGNKIGQTAFELAKENISGLEELSGIPGTFGGAIRMNAGAYGKEFKDIVEEVEVLDENGDVITLKNEDLKFEYRNSIISKEKYIVLYVLLRLKKGNKNDIEERMLELAKTRKEKQPIEYPSAGSTFKRGDSFITAKLIDECGLKGYQIGGAQISEKHAGFIINKENATSKDILDLVEYAKRKVFEKFGKNIELEIEILKN